MSREKPDSPSGSVAILLYGKSHPVERHSKSANTGESSLLRALPAGMYRPRFRFDDSRGESNLIVFQAISDQDLKSGVIFTKFICLFTSQMTGLHTPSLKLKGYTLGLAVLAEKLQIRDKFVPEAPGSGRILEG